jgi:hypothetical protein
VLFLLLLPMLVQDVYDYRRMLTGLMLVSTIIGLLIMFNPHSSYYTGRLVLDLGMIGGGVTNVGNPLATASMGQRRR